MKQIYIISIFFFITACSQTQEPSPQQTINKTTLEKLYEQYLNWQGTPYELGGNSKNGIDCSGFVTLIFQQVFHKQLPRTTLKQSKLENEIAIGELQAGDLIFFKIIGKKNLRHVGIYLENQQFLHASTSNGVIISTLKSEFGVKITGNPYVF